MVSMAIVLLLLAVLIFLFLGRLAETLADGYRQRAERRKSRVLRIQPVTDTVKSQATESAVRT